MAIKKFLLIFINLSAVLTYRHQKPVAEKVWSQYCDRQSVALNDCNWCHCDSKNQYACKARVCSEVDMFGHFNDAIKEVDVGMAGHGVWRTTSTACEPGVHYRRNELLCVCSEDGSWPNPVCRDIYQVLHSVEVTKYNHPSENQSCIPNKLHLIGCNVCICPSSGAINPKYCTSRECNEVADEPVIIKESEEEVYASCTPDKKYALGLKACRCLRNNRLLCDNTTNERRPNLRKRKSLCDIVKPHTPFENGCNLCYCNEENTMYCTVKKCLKKGFKSKLNMPVTELKTAESPADETECIAGTTFKKNCNNCYCYLDNGVKNYYCTLKQCDADIPTPHDDCVVGTSYEKNCLKCNCIEENGIKKELCSVIPCDREMKDLSSMEGYCEPLHSYKMDCNICTCLADGKTISCTSKICDKTEKPLAVDIIPVAQESMVCPDGHSYKVDCNYCFCVRNGNTICTTFNCNRK